jgi:hypothetical protein
MLRRMHRDNFALSVSEMLAELKILTECNSVFASLYWKLKESLVTYHQIQQAHWGKTLFKI